MLFALSESNEHVLIAAIVGLLTALTTLVGVVTTILLVTRRQTRQLVGEPKAGPTGKPVAPPTLTDLAATAAADKAALEAAARTLAAKTDQTAQAITEKVETVHKAVNGEGLGGKLDAVIEEQKRQGEWQRAHDAQDNQRHDEMIARFVGLRRTDGDAKPRAGG